VGLLSLERGRIVEKKKLSCSKKPKRNFAKHKGGFNPLKADHGSPEIVDNRGLPKRPTACASTVRRGGSNLMFTKKRMLHRGKGAIMRHNYDRKWSRLLQ